MRTLTPEYGREIFSRYLYEAGYAKSTIAVRLAMLKEFFSYLEVLGIEDLREVGDAELKGYIRYINEHEGVKTGKPFSHSFKVKLWGVVKLLFKSLYVAEFILKDPTEDETYLITGSEKKREILSVEEMGKFLDSIEAESPRGLRNRSLFELLYSSGLRSGEVAKLTVMDIDFPNRIVFVRRGKGHKDRFVPLSEVAVSFLKLYLSLPREQEEKLFPIKQSRVNKIFKAYLKKCGLYRPGLSVHAIRHAVAYLLPISRKPS